MADDLSSLLGNEGAVSTLTNAVTPGAPAADYTGMANGLPQIQKQAKDQLDANAQKRDRIVKEMGDIQTPAAPQLKEPHPYQEQVNNEDSPLGAFKLFAPILASLGSMKSRQPLTAAFKSAAGMINGYAQGKVEQAKMHEQAWKDQTAAALKENQQELESYKAVIENNKLTMDEKKAEIEALAGQRQDTIAIATLQQNGVLGFDKILEQRQAALQKAADQKQKQEDDKLTPEELDMYSDQILTGDRSPYTGLGRNKEAMEELRKAVADKAAKQGITGAELAKRELAFTSQNSAAKATGTREGNLETTSIELENFAKQSKEAYKGLDRGNFVPFNKLQQLVQTNTASPEQARAYAADNAVINAYATLAGKGTPTVEGALRASAVLSNVTGPEAHDAAIDQILKEAKAAQQAPVTAGQNIRSTLGGNSDGDKFKGYSVEKVQ